MKGTLRLGLAQFRELEAFAQFGSDLDKATLAQLNRGRRLVEILKQGQYQPLSVEKQVLVIYAVTNGFLDDMPLDQCRPFEQALYKQFDLSHKDLLGRIRDKAGMTDELKQAIDAGIKEAKEQFQATVATV